MPAKRHRRGFIPESGCVIRCAAVFFAVFSACFQGGRAHALLADEIRARRSQYRRRAGRAGQDGAMVRRAQLPGAQLHARRRCGSATACCSITPVAPSRASPASPKWPAAPYPDATQFDPGSQYFDPKATPRTAALDLGRRDRRWSRAVICRWPKCAAMPELEDMVLLQKGSRLSISPVSANQWKAILKKVRRKNAKS